MGAFRKKKKKKEMSGNISQYSPWVHTQVKEKSTCWFNMPPLGTVVFCGGGGGEHVAGALPTQQDGALQIVQCDESQTLTQHCLEWLSGGSESGSTFSNADLF